MKRFFVIPMILIISLCLTLPHYAKAAEDEEKEPIVSGNGLNITVVLPAVTPSVAPTPKDTTITVALPIPTPRPNPALPPIYPVDVYEYYDETGRQIIKTYALEDGDNPAGISRDSFERGGWRYDLTDITKNDNVHADTKEHTETVTVNTSGRDMETILAQLAPTMEYQSEDGYIGLLTLDISGIAVETAGTKKTSFTLTEKREYKNLSRNDPSLVPKSITEGGKSYGLDSLTWKTQKSQVVDGEKIPTSYTAVAVYTTTGTKTSVTGYNTTAQYSGTISKIVTGRTVYTAYFLGTPIQSEPGISEDTPTPDTGEETPIPDTGEETPTPTEDAPVNEIEVTPQPTDAVETTSEPEPTVLPPNPEDTEDDARPEEESEGINPWMIATCVLGFVMLCACLYKCFQKK